MSEVDHPPGARGADADDARPAWMLPVAVWLAPVAWFVHLCAGMVLGPGACTWGTELPLHLLTIGCLAVASLGAWWLWRSRTTDAATRFVVHLGLGLAALSLLAIVVVGVATLPLDGCEL